MFCSNCGTQINEGAAFCGNCGARVERGAAQPAPSAQTPVRPAQPYYPQPAPAKRGTSRTKGTSNVPMIMGIIGGLLGVPASYCSGACAELLMIAADDYSVPGIGGIYIGMGVFGALLGFTGGLLGKKFPIAAGILMIAGAFFAGITLIAGNGMALIVAVLFMLGGIFCFAQKKALV